MPITREAIVHLTISLLFFAQGVCVVCLTPDGRISFTVNHASYSDDGTRVSFEKREVCEFNVVSLVYVFLMTSAAQHAAQTNVAFFCPTLLRSYQEDFGVNWTRWSDYVLTAPVMIVVVGVTNAIFDVFVLVSLFGSVALTIILGVISDVCVTLVRASSTKKSSETWASECETRSAIGTLLTLMWFAAISGAIFYAQNERVPTYATTTIYLVMTYFAFALWLTPNGMRRADTIVSLSRPDARACARVCFFLAIVPCLYAWAVIFVTFAYALHSSEGRPPDFVYAINIVLLVLYLGPFPYVHYASLSEKENLQTNAGELKRRCETAHAALGLVSKSALAWMVYWGLRRMQDDVAVINDR
ncbi:hypothetical protein CYMTET_3845 [Cymbomonas tetramitiformis]|uniref:Uncharacterized protein n=1 Tax=Cymbomonas tetramitiformis TaxID=36881 RepID=A0AAE0H2C9_9CHLO|nr:hypothetical protein CYMTET_3845 [Cymbomonas tetramitiformis]|eukprot:gene21083-25312_t